MKTNNKNIQIINKTKLKLKTNNGMNSKGETYKIIHEACDVGVCVRACECVSPPSPLHPRSS